MNASTLVRNAWYSAGMSTDFKVGQLQGMAIAKKPVVIWRTAAEEMVAFDDRCVHKRMPLSRGKLLENGTLQCAYHGFAYDSTGKCVAIPSQLDLPIPSRAKLRPFPVIEQDGVVWLWTGDPDRIGDTRPPRTPEIIDDAFESYTFDAIQVPSNYRLLIENLVDITHFYPLHDGNIGSLEDSKIPVEYVEETVDGNPSVKTIRRVQNYRQPPFMVEHFGYDVVDREHSHWMMNPGLTRVQMKLAPPGQLGSRHELGYLLHHMHTPIDESSHIWRRTITVRKGLPAPSISSDRAIAMRQAVAQQDVWALELQQQMFDYDDDGYTEVHLRSDRAVLAVRKILETLEQAEK